MKSCNGRFKNDYILNYVHPNRPRHSWKLNWHQTITQSHPAGLMTSQIIL